MNDKPQKPLNVVVAGGGTAGHIEPALAVASVLRARGHNVIALGTERGLETRLVPARGFELKLISPVPVPRKPSIDLIKLPVRLLRTVKQTHTILKKHRTDVLIGFGGYVSAPGYLAARVARIPFIVHEANARAGMANKLGVKLGGRGLNAVSGSGMPGQVVGIPIRAEISDGGERKKAKQRAQQLWNLDPQRPTVFVTGGSQGAVSLNQAVAKALNTVIDSGYQILHAYGAKNEPPLAQSQYVPVPYIEDIAAAYAAADLVVCRAGAMTVAEVTAAGVPAVYVPLPHGNGEQGLNAKDVVAQGAAVMISDATIVNDFATTVIDLLSDPRKLHKMETAAVRSQAGNAAEVISDIVAEIAAK